MNTSSDRKEHRHAFELCDIYTVHASVFNLYLYTPSTDDRSCPTKAFKKEDK